MALIQCPECGKSISNQAVSCPSCGYPLNLHSDIDKNNQSTICPICQTPSILSMGKCLKCGFPLKQQKIEEIEEYKGHKSRSLAIFLALILGGIGAHKFYVDKPGVGLLYILFCWTFIPAIMGLFSAIRYIFMSDYEFQEKYHLGKI